MSEEPSLLRRRQRRWKGNETQEASFRTKMCKQLSTFSPQLCLSVPLKLQFEMFQQGQGIFPKFDYLPGTTGHELSAPLASFTHKLHFKSFVVSKSAAMSEGRVMHLLIALPPAPFSPPSRLFRQSLNSEKKAAHPVQRLAGSWRPGYMTLHPGITHPTLKH